MTNRSPRAVVERVRSAIRTSLRQQRTHDVVVLLLLGLAVRLTYLLVVIGGRRPRSDADQYLDIARHIAAGDGFSMQWPQLAVHPTAFRPPAYPTLLAGWIWIFGNSVLTARLLNVVIGLAAIACTYVVAEKLGAGRGGSIVAAGLIVIYPPLLANDVTTLAEPLALLLLALGVVAFIDKRWALLALCIAFLSLTKPSAQGLIVVAVVVAGLSEWRFDRSNLRTALRAGVTIIGVGLLVLSPWVIRNRVEVGTSSLVTSNGFNLSAIYGTPARERGAFVDPANDSAYQDLGNRLLRFNEADWNSTLGREGIKGLRSHPGYVATVVRRNLYAWFELTPSVNDSAEALDGRDLTFRQWTLPGFYLVTALGGVGLGAAWVTRSVNRRTLAFLIAVEGYLTVTALVFVAPPRLRSSFDWGCCIGVALLVHSIGSARSKRANSTPPSTVEESHGVEPTAT